MPRAVPCAYVTIGSINAVLPILCGGTHQLWKRPRSHWSGRGATASVPAQKDVSDVSPRYIVHNMVVRNAERVTTSRLDELVCFAIYSAANSTSQAYRQVLAPWNLTYTQYLVLVVLSDGDRTVSALGHELGLDSGTVSPLVARLEARGLVARARRDRDERVVSVSLTTEGDSTVRAVADAVGCLVPAFVGASSDLPELLRQLHEVTHNMRQLTTDLRSV